MSSLPVELVEEVLLRLPPDEPAALVRASVASKRWFGRFTSPAFRGRYRELHDAPPVLGFFYISLLHSGHKEDPASLFVSTTKFRARIPDLITAAHPTLDVVDCRHGRVILRCTDASTTMLVVVWDPMSGRARELYIDDDWCEIAVLCTVSGCDHRSCHAGPFKMVYVGVNMREYGECAAFSCVASLNMGDWSKPSDDSHLEIEEWQWDEPGDDLHLAANAFIYSMPSVLVDDALHFMLGYYDDDRVGILRYSLGSDSLSVIDAPLAESVIFRAPILMAMKDGSLGFAHVDRLTLYLWYRKIGSDGGLSWSRGRVVDLRCLLPIESPKSEPRMIGSVEGGDIIFVNTDLGIYEIDLHTLAWKERLKGDEFHALIPYMSFYNPPERVIPGDATH